jgi:hypothetical protein
MFSANKEIEIKEQKFCIRTYTCCIKLVSYLSILPKVFTSFMQQVKVLTQSKICKLHVYVVIFVIFSLLVIWAFCLRFSQGENYKNWPRKSVVYKFYYF